MCLWRTDEYYPSVYHKNTLLICSSEHCEYDDASKSFDWNPAQHFYVHFSFTPGSNPSVCLLSGTRMAYEVTLYLIGHFRSHATLDRRAPREDSDQTHVSRVETLPYFIYHCCHQLCVLLVLLNF